MRAQQTVELRPANADARIVGHLCKVEIHEVCAVDQFDGPARPREAFGANRPFEIGARQCQGLQRVRPDIEPRARLRMVVCANALVDDDVDIRAFLEKARQQSARNPGPRDRNARTALHLDFWR